MAYRATKSGLAAEAQGKIRGKYDQGEAQKALTFISQKIGEGFSTSGDMDNFQNQLKDGVKLCKLVNALKPGSIPEKKYATPPTMSFKQMELIGLAIDKMKQLGVPDHEMFQTVDLYEGQNLHQCVIGIGALARKMGAYGPKEADANKRDFTEEQLKAGQNIIGLQMGTNKGANQSGMNIGNTRHIVD
ncbi:myophilin-like [Crassostrea angulata]|uniref:Transgelin n=1 Tax=Magallana gigas TaxID=29159 RepID=A0A8W8JM82_MAGGI|nr:myophilin [Crassostrea gigas]XP_052709764.1 myophilin-like [Crassostrea angulata]